MSDGTLPCLLDSILLLSNTHRTFTQGKIFLSSDSFLKDTCQLDDIIVVMKDIEHLPSTFSFSQDKKSSKLDTNVPSFKTEGNHFTD